MRYFLLVALTVVITSAAAKAAPFSNDPAGPSFVAYELSHQHKAMILESMKKLASRDPRGTSIDQLHATRSWEGIVYVCGWATLPSTAISRDPVGKPPAYIAFGGMFVGGKFLRSYVGKADGSPYSLFGPRGVSENTVRLFCSDWEIDLPPLSQKASERNAQCMSISKEYDSCEAAT